MWIMPLLFVLSGAAVYYSLKSRSGGAFVKERFMRLMVPLLTLGIFVFGPVQIYLERLSHGDFSGSFWAFIPHYFEGMYGFGGNFAWMGVHMWYLLFLFLYTLLLLGLFLPSHKSGVSPASKLARHVASPWALFLLFIPIAVAFKLTDALGMEFTRGMGGWDMFSYILFLLYGYLLVANPGVIQTVKKYAFGSLTLAVAATAGWLVMVYAVMPNPDQGFVAKDELEIIATWMSILAILGLGARFLERKSPALAYSNEAVLPFYILHQPFLLIIGYFVVRWDMPVLAKYLIIGSLAFVAIMAVYEFAVRRLPALRFLFGMKKLEAAPKAAAQPSLVSEPVKE